ncbi:hypothetical protein BCR35DRAFT_335231 [Leucosporidium creatinivorum]|uniref:Uncharacterized protein n=1 Tax=Leucosporidium creatinivorum TaxID=106004 RepID=A0A1Y2DFE0_9BASI|nr:hypothetical protein BCR35DRAFT_335231 [Leucosporidium creatinivorum]
MTNDNLQAIDSRAARASSSPSSAHALILEARRAFHFTLNAEHQDWKHHKIACKAHRKAFSALDERALANPKEAALVPELEGFSNEMVTELGTSFCGPPSTLATRPRGITRIELVTLEDYRNQDPSAVMPSLKDFEARGSAKVKATGMAKAFVILHGVDPASDRKSLIRRDLTAAIGSYPWDASNIKINDNWASTFRTAINGPKKYSVEQLLVLDLLASEGMKSTLEILNWTFEETVSSVVNEDK